MASKSSDHTRPNSVRDSDRACARKSDKHKKAHEDDIHPHEVSGPESPLSAEKSGSAEDEELLEMLEQLSKTIDTAHNVIAGQPALSSSGLLSGEARASQEQVSGLELPLPPPVAPARRRVLVPVLATAFSLFFGIAALAAIWLFWNSPEWAGHIDLTKKQDRIAAATVSRTHQADVKTRSLASLPAKTTPLHSPPSSAPEPLKAIEPAMKPEPPAKIIAFVEPEIDVVKETPQSASVAVEKAPVPPAFGKEEETQILERGRKLISTGDVASARLAFEYAAHRGSADAMFALAQTFDVDVLASLNVVGIEPDANIALKWYGRAAQNGHDPADARASELEQLSNHQGRR